MNLTDTQLDLVRASLKFTLEKFKTYRYPSEKHKSERIAEVNDILAVLSNTKADAFTAEELRTFMIRRPWLHGPDRLITDSDYASLKDRDGKFWRSLSAHQRAYFCGFIDGWKKLAALHQR
jgi:hypothetical protein